MYLMSCCHDPEVLRAAHQHLPATVQQLAERCGRTSAWAGKAMAELRRQGLAEQWGRELTAAGTLAPVYQRTDKPFVVL